MNEVQIYSTVMFFAGAILCQAVFYFDKVRKKKMFYLFLSSIILQVLENINITHMAALEFTADKTKTVDEIEAEEYLQLEKQKLSVFMELYVLLFTRAVPMEGRKYINYKSWSAAKALIEELRGFMKDEQGKG